MITALWSWTIGLWCRISRHYFSSMLCIPVWLLTILTYYCSLSELLHPNTSAVWTDQASLSKCGAIFTQATQIKNISKKSYQCLSWDKCTKKDILRHYFTKSSRCDWNYWSSALLLFMYLHYQITIRLIWMCEVLLSCSNEWSLPKTLLVVQCPLVVSWGLNLLTSHIWFFFFISEWQSGSIQVTLFSDMWNENW